MSALVLGLMGDDVGTVGACCEVRECAMGGSSSGVVCGCESSVLHRNVVCSWCGVVNRLADISLVPPGF